MLSSLKKSFPESFGDLKAVPVDKSFSIKNINFTESDNGESSSMKHVSEERQDLKAKTDEYARKLE